MHHIALIGAGRIGRIHAANIQQHSQLKLACVIDAMPAAAAALADQYHCPVVTLDAALTDTSIRGVVVASSTDTHLDYTLQASQMGKAVFCEKPLDQDLQRAQSAARQLMNAPGPVFLAFNRRFDPNFLTLRQRLKEGAIGQLETLHIISHDPAPPPVAYLATSGGLFKDMVIHDFDMARWLLDEAVTQVFSTTSCLVDPAIAEAGDVDTAKTILRTASGKLCFISSSRRSGYGYDQRLEAYGSKGMLCANNVTESTVQHWSQDGAAADRFQNFFLDRYAAAYAAEMNHFAEMISQGIKPLIGYADGVAALALAETAARSAKSGRFESI